MTIAEAMGDDPNPLDVRVFATDIDSAAIAFARRGLYPPAALQKVPAALRKRYFVKSDGGYEVAKTAAVADDLRRARPRRSGAVPPDRPRPLPQRPDLLHAADAAGRARDLRLLAPRRGSPRPRAVGDRRRDARPVRRGAVLGCGSIAACPGRTVAPALAAEADSGPRATPTCRSTRRSARPAATSGRRPTRPRRPRRCCSTWGSGSWSSIGATTSSRINTAARRMLGIHGLGVRPGLHPPRRIAPLDGGPRRDRCRAQRQDDHDGARGRGGRRHAGRGPLHRGRHSTEPAARQAPSRARSSS